MAIPLVIALSGLWKIIVACYVLLAAVFVVMIVHAKRDPTKALAWIMLITFVPVAGIAIYILFGRNHRKDKIFSRKELKDLRTLEQLSRQQLESLHAATDGQLPEALRANREVIALLLNNNKALLTMHNRVRVLNNGKATFAAMFEALRAAKTSIHLEYYIFESDRLGQKIGRILMDKARKGVEVRLIYDDVGSWGLSQRYLRKLRAAGVKVGCFMPVAFPWFTSKVNYRNHRKILVVDGHVAFTGGINIAERYLRGDHIGKWRDTHLRLEGESVAMLQGIFAMDWYFVTREILDLPRYLPKSTVTETSPLQIASSGPDSDWASIMQAFFAAITKAQKYIYISTPYFLPNQAIMTALKVAALSGIDVKVMIPSRSDSKITYWASRSYIGEMIDADIKVYLYKKGFNHSKLIMIDGRFSSVGTANMDIRSFEDNFEVSALMYDPEIARQLEAEFHKDLTHSTPATKEWWENKPLKHSIYESLARLMSPLL